MKKIPFDSEAGKRFLILFLAVLLSIDIIGLASVGLVLLQDTELSAVDEILKIVLWALLIGHVIVVLVVIGFGNSVVSEWTEKEKLKTVLAIGFAGAASVAGAALLPKGAELGSQEVAAYVGALIAFSTLVDLGGTTHAFEKIDS